MLVGVRRLLYVEELQPKKWSFPPLNSVFTQALHNKINSIRIWLFFNGPVQVQF